MPLSVGGPNASFGGRSWTLQMSMMCAEKVGHGNFIFYFLMIFPAPFSCSLTLQAMHGRAHYAYCIYFIHFIILLVWIVLLLLL